MFLTQLSYQTNSAPQTTGLKVKQPSLTLHNQVRSSLFSETDSFKFGAYTALHQAAAKGDVPGVHAALQDSNIDINESDPQGNTALHAASIEGSTSIVRLLLGRSGIDWQATNRDGLTAQQLAEEENENNSHQGVIREFQRKAGH